MSIIQEERDKDGKLVAVLVQDGYGAKWLYSADAELRRIEILGLKYWLHAVKTNMIRDGDDGVKLIQSEVEQGK